MQMNHKIDDEVTCESLGKSAGVGPAKGAKEFTARDRKGSFSPAGPKMIGSNQPCSSSA